MGEKIRSLILDGETERMPRTEAMLFLAARTELVHRTIKPILQKNWQIILLDRYVDSTLVYQGFVQGLDQEEIWRMHTHWPIELIPHKTFWLNISLETSLLRQKLRGLPPDYFESWDQQKSEHIIKGYATLAQKFRSRIVELNGEQPAEEVLQQCLKVLCEQLG
jgi:dTMP kinase